MKKALEALGNELPADRVLVDPAERRARARDLWPRLLVRERDGDAPTAPGAVVLPETEAEVQTVVQWAREHRVPLVPRGAGAGVLGAAAPLDEAAVVLDLSRMKRVHPPDPVNQTVRVQPGVIGMDLERALEAHGFTSGHYPQSLPLSSVGGFLATRSSGQASTRYGNIENLVVGLRAVLGTGEVLEVPAMPRTSTGPSLIELFLGSEGVFGVVTEVTLRVFRAPEARRFVAYRFPGFDEGLQAARETLQRGGKPAVLRVHDPDDTMIAFAAQDIPGADEGGCMLVAVVEEGTRALADAQAALLADACSAAGGTDLGPEPAKAWWETRYALGERLHDIIEGGGVVDTLEIAAPYAHLLPVWDAVREAVQGEEAMVLCHGSHFYVDGANLYFTFLGHGGVDAHEQLWRAALTAARGAGASVAHHHGVGVARLREVEVELGAGADVWRRVKAALDPEGVLNPGKFGRAPP